MSISFLAMIPVLVCVLLILRDSLRTRVALQAEILALHHQLLVLDRRKQKQRPRLSQADRLLWAWLSRIWPDWKSCAPQKHLRGQATLSSSQYS
jgi:hypothetical protein